MSYAFERPTSQSLQLTKMRVNALFAMWLSSPEGEHVVRPLVQEMLAASRAASVPASVGNTQPGRTPTPPMRDSEGGSVLLEARPGSPQQHGQASPYVRDAAIFANRASSPTTGRLGVDEVDMHRAQSPGGASPMSPTAMSRTAHHVVDPSLPLAHPTSPDRHRPGSPLFASALVIPSNTASSISPPPSPAAPSISGSMSRQTSLTPLLAAAGGVAGGAVASVQDIPPFYKPRGAALNNVEEARQELEALQNAFGASRTASASRGGPAGGRRSTTMEIDNIKAFKRANFEGIAKEVFKIPAWLRDALFKRILQFNALPDNGPSTVLRYAEVRKYYDAHMSHLTSNRRLFELIRIDSERENITHDDLVHTMRHLVSSHAGLAFLTQREFQDLYCRTAAVRIVYLLERNHSRHVRWADFDRSDLPDVLRGLDDETDINRVLRYFSYEHFYVLYCRFYELDFDRDHLVSLKDLCSYSNNQVSVRALERVVNGRGRPLVSNTAQMLDFEDFIYFCLSEEDKTTDAAKLYWFNVLDLDGDGVLTGHELQYFLDDQRGMLERLASDELKLDDLLCQTFDMIAQELPVKQGIRLVDLKRSGLSDVFINLLTNATKFIMFEQRDPFGEHQMRQAPEKTPWDRFARSEYDRMAQEAVS